MNPDTPGSDGQTDTSGRQLAILDRIKLGFIVTGEDGSVSYANEKAAALLGMSRERLAGANILSLRRERFSHLFAPYFDNARSSGRPVKFEEMLQPSADVSRLRYSFYPAGPDMVVTIEDASAEWRAGEGLRMAALSISRLPDAVFLVHESGRIFHTNETARRFTGYGEEELKGMPVREILSGLDFSAQQWDERADSACSEWPMKRKGGEILPVEVYLSRRTFYRMTQYVVTARDITGRKQAEEELKAMKQQAELYLDLMGHDINNMNQIAMDYLELARGMQKDDNAREFIDKPMEMMQRCTELIRNVRKLQKLQDGALQTWVIDVGAVLADVQQEFGTVPGKAVRLETNGCGPCRVRANDLLRDVFANLAGNAVKHTGDRADIVIDMGILEDDGCRYCRVTVTDDGPGIPDDAKGRLFVRLQRGDTQAHGKGLGLYLVRSLVESFDGTVWIEDRVPRDYTKGAKFVVMLPMA